MGPLLRCNTGVLGKRVERCQRTVLRGQQAPESRCRTQGLKRRRSGGRSSRRTSGTKMPRCRSELPAARRERGRERHSFRAQRTGPTERARSPKCAAQPVATLRTGRLRFPSAFGAVISRFAIEHFLKLPRLDGRKYPSDEFRWNGRQPFGIDDIAFDEVGSSPKPIGGSKQPGMNQRRSADDNDPAIAK
jgi:hypothetical protein